MREIRNALSSLGGHNARSAAFWRNLAHLRECLGPASRIDLPSFDEVAASVAERGGALDRAWAPPRLQPGETYVVFDAEGNGEACLIRARAHPYRLVLDSDRVVLDLDARESTRIALTGLAKVLRRHARAPARTGVQVGWRLPISLLKQRPLVTGPSLGLAVAIAVVSSWKGRAPPEDVAATAAVDSEGKLGPVGGLEGKVRALAARWPNVKRLVVAKRQHVPGEFLGEVVACDTIWEALAAFGLVPTVAELPADDADVLKHRVEGFSAVENQLGHDPRGWVAIATEAEIAAEALASLGEPALAARAASWSLLFRLHAGDPRPGEILGRFECERWLSEMEPAPAAWVRIIQATNAVDRDPVSALPFADDAILRAGELRGDSRRELWGRAVGTKGRVLMHAGRSEEALTFLRDAAEFHSRERAREAARSLCYEATCLRKLGRLADARDRAERGIELAISIGGAGAESTARYLNLELGRILMDLAELDGAEVAFLRATDRLRPDDVEDPHVRALRGLAAVHRRRRRADVAGPLLERVLAVAEACERSFAQLASVAFDGAGEALLDERDGFESGVPLERLHACWSRGGPGRTGDIAEIRSHLAASIY